MVEKLISFSIRQLRASELRAFLMRVNKFIAASNLTTGRAFEELKRAAQELNAALGEKPELHSYSLEELDSIADNAWYAVHYQLKASLLHPRPEVRKAAEAVDAIFSKTPDPTELCYAEEYRALRTLLEQLKALTPETLRTAHVDELLEALRKAVADFDTASGLGSCKSNVDLGRIRDSALKCHTAWRSISRYLEAVQDYETLPVAGGVIGQINKLVQRVQKQLEIRKTQNNSEKSDINMDED